VFPAEADAVAAIRLRIAKGTTVHADESPAWNMLHASFAMQRITSTRGIGRRFRASHYACLPPRSRIIRETDSHNPGDRFASTWRHSQEPGTRQMADSRAFE
jgi:hypothetical protein